MAACEATVDETVDAFAEETDDLDGTLADDSLDDDIPDAQDESVFASEEAVLDEEALREMVAELVREELQERQAFPKQFRSGS